MKLVAGKRYEWPVTVPSDGRMKDGLFTGQYALNGSAIMRTKTGNEWFVDPKSCQMKVAKGKQ